MKKAFTIRRRGGEPGDGQAVLEADTPKTLDRNAGGGPGQGATLVLSADREHDPAAARELDVAPALQAHPRPLLSEDRSLSLATANDQAIFVDSKHMTAKEELASTIRSNPGGGSPKVCTRGGAASTIEQPWLLPERPPGRPLRYISLCSGIEAASAAWEGFGWEALAFSEVEPFASEVLRVRFPGVPNHGDMARFDWSAYRGKADVVVAGCPCQDFSLAGLRAGLAGDRGNLSLQFIRIVDAINPAFVLWENVPGVLTAGGKENDGEEEEAKGPGAFGCFLGGLVGENSPLKPPGTRWPDAGVVAGPKRAAAWRTLDAQHFGLAQRRRRVFVIACPRGGPNPAAVLFEHRDPRWGAAIRAGRPSLPFVARELLRDPALVEALLGPAGMAAWESLPHSFANGGMRVWLLDPRELADTALNVSDSPNDPIHTPLSAILEEGPVPHRYFLSPEACDGILRRAEERGKGLPPQLDAALRRAAGQAPTLNTSYDGHAVLPAETAGTLTADYYKEPNNQSTGDGHLIIPRRPPPSAAGRKPA